MDPTICGVPIFNSDELPSGHTLPRVEKVAYSTCSIHPEDSEQVALQSLEATCGVFWPRARWTFLSGHDSDNQGSWMTQVVAYGSSRSPMLPANFYLFASHGGRHTVLARGRRHALPSLRGYQRWFTIQYGRRG